MLDVAISRVWLHCSTYHLMGEREKTICILQIFLFCNWELNRGCLCTKQERNPLHHCFTKIAAIKKNEKLFIWCKCCHLTLSLHLMEPNWRRRLLLSLFLHLIVNVDLACRWLGLLIGIQILALDTLHSKCYEIFSDRTEFWNKTFRTNMLLMLLFGLGH